MTDGKTPEKKLVKFEKKGHVGRIILNRPEKRNAMNLRVWKALDEAVAAADEDPGGSGGGADRRGKIFLCGNRSGS
ncbi:MAG: hypothetical protein U5R49_21350 [Deltaproteobacteria bacterium]|nr:hypothetical protein [Deltaproteobacteria bacterium]